ncbi:MAG TPA: response regulator [Ktedonobacteraceae bacterium]|nr:response regulator [Ktedonobacteraceae bacterium]
MNRKGRVLVVDDLETWRKELTLTLQREGYHTDSASTTAEVQERLNETFYHLLILDIRLEDSDSSNTEGIELLRELGERGLGEATAVIILSAYGTQEQMRLAFKDYKVADFLSKNNFSRSLFLQSVRQVFLDLHINLSLVIQWQQVKRPEEVVVNLEIEGVRLKRNPALQSRIAADLDDLLCRLFYPASSILVQPLAMGQSATGVLWVEPFYDSGGANAVVVKFGDFHKIQEEEINFKQYVQPFVGGGRNTAVFGRARTARLGGIIYSLLGTANDHLEDFGSYYRHSSVNEIAGVLDHLFLHTCRAWYANAGHLRPLDLTRDYQQMFGFTTKKLERALLELQKYVQGGQKLVFKSLKSDRLFTNPLLALEGPPLIRSTYTCITHGDLNQHNLLVDSSGHTWLIDFQGTGQGHILRDLAQLDSEIRFFLLAPGEATLEERLCMEEVLCSPDRFSQVAYLESTLPTQNPSLAKAYATVVHLRTLACKLVSQNPGDDISEYYIALFYNAVNTLRFYGLSSMQREHALLCASLLADRLELRR